MTRREALAAGAAALGTAALASSAAGEQEQGNWIDAHSHVWSPDTERFPLAAGQTKADLKPLSFTDEELMALARPEGVTRAVLIQHSTYHMFDNAGLIDPIRRHPERFRAVGMVDDRRPGAGESMKRLLPQGVTAFRITPWIVKDKRGWLSTDGMHEMWKTAAQTRQTMSCLIDPPDLPGVDAMCERYPETPVVIDHFARIGVDGQIRDADLNALCKLAGRNQVSVKVSAFYALGAKKPPYLDLAQMIRRVYEAFGPQRLMWASDCPYQVADKPHTYADSIALVRDRLDFLSADDRQWMLRKTAERVYFFA